MTLTAHTVAQFTQPPSVALFRQFQCVYLLEKVHFIFGCQRTPQATGLAPQHPPRSASYWQAAQQGIGTSTYAHGTAQRTKYAFMSHYIQHLQKDFQFLRLFKLAEVGGHPKTPEYLGITEVSHQILRKLQGKHQAVRIQSAHLTRYQPEAPQRRANLCHSTCQSHPLFHSPDTTFQIVPARSRLLSTTHFLEE